MESPEQGKTKAETLRLWIARDKDGALYLYECKPIRQDLAVYFDCEKGENADLSWLGHLFPEVTFENSPQQVELISSEEYKRLKDIQEDWLKHVGYGPDAYD